MNTDIFSTPQTARKCTEIPIYRYGYTDVLGAPPQLSDDEGFQKGNCSQAEKLMLKRSPQISFNMLGSTAPRMPRSEEFDYLAVEPGALIDGNDFTSWMSPPQYRDNVAPVCIRIDLPVERELQKIVLKKRTVMVPRCQWGWMCPGDAQEVGRGMAGQLKIEVSCDAYDWETVFEGESGDAPERDEFEFAFKPSRAKQIRIIGTDLPRVEVLLHSFSIARVCVFDTSGREVSLASYGATVCAPCFHTFQQPRELHRWYWPLQSELGFKWARIGYHDDPLNWHWVEREKGVLRIDPEAEAAIDWLAENDINLIFNLGFGNRLYTDEPERKMTLLAEWNFDMPRPPRGEEALAAWERYVEFIVRRFAKRVRVFEVWNEWDISGYWGEEPDYELYREIFMRAERIIRREAPDALLMLGSVAVFPYGIASWDAERSEREWRENYRLRAVAELAPLTDAVGWHPFYNTDTCSQQYEKFPEDMRALKVETARYGFKGTHMISEFSWFAPYPTPYPNNIFGSGFEISELQKAKILACMALRCGALSMPMLYCETWNTNFFGDLSLLRRTYGDGVLTEAQPTPAFYTMRNLSTLLDGFTAADYSVLALDTAENCERAALTNGSEILLAVWRRGCPQDLSSQTEVDIKLNFDCLSAGIADPVNGELCSLKIENCRTLKDVLLRDYPLLIRVTPCRVTDITQENK